jgi:predicted anti-sigma-YlaC factor YlaD
MLWLRLTRLLALLAAMCAGGCATLKHSAVNRLGDALAAGGTTYAADDDPALVQAAAPFSLKLMESLLAETPEHPGLLLAATSGFTQYAYAFVQQDADEIAENNLAAATALRHRARRLYLRAHNYGLRGLAVAHPDFPALLQRDAHAATQLCTATDVPLLYWTAASWCAAIALAKDQPELITELPQAEALIDRALALGEDFDHGAIHTFFITYEMSRVGASGDPAERAEQHFNRALALGGGNQAAPFVALAEAVCVQRQDRARFQSLLAQALAIDPDARPESRLLNLVMQHRARWLLARTDELFLAVETPPEPKP